MPNPREVYKQRAQQEAGEEVAESTVPQQETGEEVARSTSDQALPQTDAAQVAESDQAPEKASEQTSEQTPEQASEQASEEVASQEPASEPEIADASETVTEEPSVKPVGTSNSQDLKGKPSPRRGKVEQKVDRKDDAKIKAAKRESRRRIVKKLVIVLLVVVVAAVIGGFIYLRWFVQDDAQSFKGKWQISGTEGTIEITDTKIILNDEVSYDYVLDPASKTFGFTFGTLEGTARYRFSFDGDQLSLTDGDFDFMSTLFEDSPWMIGALVNPNANPPTLGDGSMLLERIE